jgi:hypothetical protein
MSPQISPEFEQAQDIIFKIVRRHMLGLEIGPDILADARRLVGTWWPDRMAELRRRRAKDGLDPISDAEEETLS